MEQNNNTLCTRIDELTRRLERHEWRILDLEKRLSSALQQIDKEHCDDADGEFKEPILKKAATSVGALVKGRSDTYIVWLMGIAIGCVMVGFVVMSLA